MNRVVPAALVVLAVLLTFGLCGCAQHDGVPTAEPSQSATALDVGLRDELLTMAREDQSEMQGEAVIDDRERVERLGEIFDEYGWPGYDLVGEKAGDAAWLVAQHADLNLAFQKRALDLLMQAVDDGQASLGNLAYLEDRVAVAEGKPQTYGTQIACSKTGPPKPSTPISDRDGLDERRRDAGLPPYDRYLQKMTRICSLG